MFKSFLFLSVLLLPLSMKSQPKHDDVVISKCTDKYRLTENGKTPVVENTEETEYELNSVMPQTVRPSIYYGEFISLDNAKCGDYKAQYKNITPENVFYDDTKMCYFIANLRPKFAHATARFKRTFKDIRYCARIYLPTNYRIKKKNVVVTIPTSFKGYRLVERNFDGNITCERKLVGRDSVFTYTITDMPAMKDEEHMPPLSMVYPHLLIIGPFADYQDLYRWSINMSNVNCELPNGKQLIADITKGCKSDEDKINATYSWVQKNIRYVAFEAGVAGHRPDTPSEVVRKRFGDCKGMSLLLKTLLKAQGFDARLAFIGTTDIPYRISDIPTLAATNHVVCALMKQGKTYFLDATYSNIPYAYIPQHIQGQQTMIENGDKCMLQTVPTLPAETSKDKLVYQYKLVNGNKLEGVATYSICGDMKEYFLSIYNAAVQTDKNSILSNNLNADDHSNQVSNAEWKQNKSQDTWAIFTGKVVNPHAVQALDNELYVELNPHNNFFISKIDTTDRVYDFCMPQPCNIVRQVELTIPAGYKLSHLPEAFSVSTPQGTLSCNFEKQNGKVIFTQRMKIDNKRIARKDIVRWNEAVSKWTDACNEQIILKK